MSFNLRNRSLLTVQDYTPREFRFLLDLARDLKRAKYARTEQKQPLGDILGIAFVREMLELQPFHRGTELGRPLRMGRKPLEKHRLFHPMRVLYE